MYVRVNWINHTSCFIDTTDMRPPSFIDYSQNTRGIALIILKARHPSHNETDLSFEVSIGRATDVPKIDFHLYLLILLGKSVCVEVNKKFISGMHTSKDITYAFAVPSVGATINGLFMFCFCLVFYHHFLA